MATPTSRANARVPGLPGGWNVIQYAEAINDPRDAVVLCQRTVEDGDHGTKYVVWDDNRVEGGCYNGKYEDTYTGAMAHFNTRKGRLR